MEKEHMYNYWEDFFSNEAMAHCWAETVVFFFNFLVCSVKKGQETLT